MGVPNGAPGFSTKTRARPFFRKALDLGINFFDTADVYSLGASEEVTGGALLGYAARKDVVIASKLCQPMGAGPNDRGLGRKHVMEAIDATLRRLGTDYVDLYQIHRLDHDTPIEEIMDALNDVVKAGKALYIGASSMLAYEFVKMQAAADSHGWTRFVSMQPHYNLVYREEEREMLRYCEEDGIGVIPWSPLARGLLAGNRKPDLSAAESVRSTNDPLANELYGLKEDFEVIDQVKAVAAKHGVKPIQVALAWLLHKPVVTAPIIGATKLHYLDDAAGALAVRLDGQDMERLESAYVPHRPMSLVPARQSAKQIAPRDRVRPHPELAEG